jgi:hypothetical protein
MPVLLAEYRDEVFARLAADLREAGCSVRRAECGAKAGPLCQTTPVGLFITHVDLPDESGWLTAAKVRLLLPDVPIWLYTPGEVPFGASLAEYVGVDQRIHYGGDLWRLSEDIIGLLPAVRRDRNGSRSVRWGILARQERKPGGELPITVARRMHECGRGRKRRARVRFGAEVGSNSESQSLLLSGGEANSEPNVW